jgi:hypothetical protein
MFESKGSPLVLGRGDDTACAAFIEGCEVDLDFEVEGGERPVILAARHQLWGSCQPRPAIQVSAEEEDDLTNGIVRLQVDTKSACIQSYVFVTMPSII